MMRARVIVGSVAIALLTACGENPQTGQVTDPELYSPPIARKPALEIPSEPRTLEPMEVAGVAMAPREYYEGKLRILLPKAAREIAVQPSMRGADSKGPDFAGRTPGNDLMFAIGLTGIPQLASRVDDEFGYVTGQIESSYPPGAVIRKELVAQDGRHWIHMEIKSDRHVFIAMTSLKQEWLRIEAILGPNADSRWTEVVRKMLENTVTADGHY